MTEGLEPLSETLEEAREEARARSIQGDIRDLAGHALGYARAEFAFQKTRATYAGKGAFWIALWLGTALAFLLLTVMGLVFGLILALSPLLTAWGATGAVCGALLLVAALFGFAAYRRWRTMLDLFDEEDAA